LSTRASMSLARQATMRGPILTGRGYRPTLIPSHHDEELTGIGPRGARISRRRRRDGGRLG
jgi:hypothetical protein